MSDYSFPKTEILEQYQYISFDLFDTLITRDVQIPHHIFRDKGIFFSTLRRFSELIIRKSRYFSKREPSLDEVYRLLPFWEKEEELELERIHTRLVPSGLECFRSAQELGKDIFIISDMYLPSSFLGELLYSHGFEEPYTLIVSAEYGRSKGNGLFDLVFKDFDRNFILHMGDNFYADYLAPRSTGIHAIRILNK